MNALRRVAAAPGLVLFVILAQLAVAATIGAAVRSGVGAAMGRFAFLADGHFLDAVINLLIDEPGLAAAAPTLVAGSTVVAFLFWTLLAGGVLVRLRSPVPAPKIAAAAVRHLPAVVVVSLWHLVPRAVLLVAAGALTAKLLWPAEAWGLAGLALLFAVLAYVTCALDLARADVVLHGAPRFDPRTAWRGYVRAARRRDVLWRSALFSAGQWAAVVAILVLAVAGAGNAATIWLVRLLSILGLVCGLARLAVAVEAGPPSARP